MKTLTTQHPKPARKMSWRLLPALLVAVLSFCAISSNGQTWTIGTGTSQYGQTGTPLSPLGHYYQSGRVQYLYTAAEMTAAGMVAGPIHQIAFDVAALQSADPAMNYNIGIDHTSLTNLVASPVVQNGFTNRFSSAGGISVGLGWNYITLNTLFNWNGTDNIIIDICFSKGTSVYGAGAAGVRYHTATSGKSLYITNTTGTNLCNAPLAGTTTTARPNIRFVKLAPCSGQPFAAGGVVKGNLSPSGNTSTLCPGSSVNISSSGFTNALSTQFIWLWATTPTGPWTAAPGFNTGTSYTTPPMVSATYYRLAVVCNNSGQVDTSATTSFTFPGGFPVYGALPYFEGFESWGNGCATSDKISSNNWTNTPATGGSSWRREDQGASASWANATSAFPAAFEGSHYARWHGYTTPAGDGGAGTLQLYVNTSATAGAKDLSFYYHFQYGTPQPTYPIDSLIVDMSTDGGATFTPLPGGRIGAATGPAKTWNLVTIPNIMVNSPTTVFRFKAKHGSSAGYVDDIYLDAVRIDEPCQVAPTAGVIDSAYPCSGKPFKLKLKGNTLAAGLSYLWQYKSPTSTFWSPLPGGNVASPTATITGTTDFRAIVFCNNTTPVTSDTTPVYRMTLAPFYYCYCDAGISPSYWSSPYYYVLVGNVKISTDPAGTVLLNNGNALPTLSNLAANFAGYEDFRLTVPAPTLILDSTYRLALTQTSYYSYWYSSYANAWLDIDQNGRFDASEQIMNNRAITNQSSPSTSVAFQIPANAPVGLTGLRVSLSMYNSPTVTPCGIQNNYIQYEDYLVRIEYQPCTGPMDPGTAYASDTAICPGYTVDLIDTSYQKTRTNGQRMWEVSTNGGASFAAIPGSGNKDSIKDVVVTASSKYRLRMICGPTGDTTYSNELTVRSPEPVRCYPISWAAPGGDADSSDIGSFILGNFENPLPSFPAGPHLLNPLAHQRRSDFTLMPPIELHADSTYRLAVFHTMPRGYHSDAMVSVYMDFNNDLKYDQFVSAPPFTSELIYQGITEFDSFFLDTKIKIPSAVIPNVPTGMRVVLNNDVSSTTAPGNSGRGVFTSGEVEDYIVIFRRAGLNVGAQNLLQNLALYPNPTEGKFIVSSEAARAVSRLDVVVSTITGQQVLSCSFDNVGTQFRTELDLTSQAKGIYFVEIRADGEKITKKLTIR